MRVKQLLVISLLVIGGVALWYQKQWMSVPEITEPETIKIVSSDPEPLEEATILPNQPIVITFNKAFDTGRLKIRLEPEVALEVKTSKTNEPTNTITINFKKLLQLGSGYTLFIVPDPADGEKLPLEKDYIFHFKTIGYRGV